MRDHCQNHIDGERIDGGARRVEVTNPGAGEKLAEHALADEADVNRVVPCFLELGGKSAAIVHEDADLVAFENDIRWAIYLNVVRARAKAGPSLDEFPVPLLVMVCGGASDLGKSLKLLEEYSVSEDKVSLFHHCGYSNPDLRRAETNDGRAFGKTYLYLWKDESGWRIRTRGKGPSTGRKRGGFPRKPLLRRRVLEKTVINEILRRGAGIVFNPPVSRQKSIDTGRDKK